MTRTRACTIMARKCGAVLVSARWHSTSTSVAAWRPTDTGSYNPAQQIGPRRSQASSFVAADLGEHEQQYLTSSAA